MIGNGNESSAFNLTDNGTLIVRGQLDVNKKSKYTVSNFLLQNVIKKLE